MRAVARLLKRTEGTFPFEDWIIFAQAMRSPILRAESFPKIEHEWLLMTRVLKLFPAFSQKARKELGHAAVGGMSTHRGLPCGEEAEDLSHDVVRLNGLKKELGMSGTIQHK